MIQTVSARASSTGNGSASTAPNRLGLRSSSAAFPVPKPDKAEHLLGETITNEVWSRLPISRLGETGHRGIEHVIGIVSASCSQITAVYHELQTFVTAVIDAAIEQRGIPASQEVLSTVHVNQRTRLLEDIRFPLPPRSFVDFEFANLPVDEAVALADARLKKACSEFSRQLLSLLKQLQEQQLVGEIHRTESTCRFTFFRRVALVEDVSSKTFERANLRNDPVFQIPGHTVFLYDLYERVEASIQHRHALHVHHVRDPMFSDYGQTKYPLPEKYRSLVQCCPDWMQPCLSILEGELIREERIEWDLFTEKVADRKFIERRRSCPAVMLGDYVLAGWNEQAINEERRKRSDVANARELNATSKQFAVLAVAAALSSLLAIGLSASSTALMVSIAILLGVAATFFSAAWTHCRDAARRSLHTEQVLYTAVTCGASLFASQCLLFSIRHASLSALATAFSFLAVLVIAVAIRNQKG